MKFKTKKTEWDSPHYNTAAPDTSDIIKKNQGRYYRGTVTRTFSSQDPQGAELMMITVTLKSSREENNLSKNLDLTSENSLEDSPSLLAMSLSEVTVTPLSNEEQLPDVGDEVLVMIIDNIDSSLYNTDGYYVKMIEPISLSSKLSEYAKGFLKWAGVTPQSTASSFAGSGAGGAPTRYPNPPPVLPKGNIIPSSVQVSEDGIPSFTETRDKSEQQKYDFYSQKVIAKGYQVENKVNQPHIITIRKRTNYYANDGRGVYDDRVAVIWLDSSGTKRAREFIGNTEPSGRIHGNLAYEQWKKGVPRDKITAKISWSPGVAYDKEQYNYALYKWKYGNALNSIKKPYHPSYYEYKPVQFPYDGWSPRSHEGKRTPQFLFHSGGNSTVGSAGCQTFPKNQYRQFWNLIASFNIRYQDYKRLIKYDIIEE